VGGGWAVKHKMVVMNVPILVASDVTIDAKQKDLRSYSRAYKDVTIYLALHSLSINSFLPYIVKVKIQFVCAIRKEQTR